MRADVGNKLRVKVSFTDDDSNDEELTSDAYPASGTVLANTAPTASASSVTTNEDTAHTFATADFNFTDSDGDAMASVTVVTLPAEGALELDGTPVTTGQSVPAADIGKLAFTPAANAHGDAYASFTFRVHDGTDESAAGYTMTVNVTAMNDPATGAPTISGTAVVGQTLTAATLGIADVDGLTRPTYGYQWVRVDTDGTSNPTDITGATSATYKQVEADVGRKLRVTVSFTDDDGNDEELTSAPTATETVLDPTVGICGRTPQVRDALVALIPVVSNCADVTATHLAAITGTLELSGQQITALAVGDFAVGDFVGLTSLTHLSLYSNALTTLPTGVFDELTALTELLLGSNQLSTLPAGVFDGLTRLETLALHNNALTMLDAGVFDGLTALTSLNLHGTKLATLSDDVFKPLTALAELLLGGNSLTTLPADVFNGLTSLTVLRLARNELTTLPAGVFDGLTSLTQLYLNNNELTTLDDDVFEPLTALIALTLRDNPGAPFAPEAVALPDDGTVPTAGGMVTLDGSGSDGGPWGTNVTYGWALTDPVSGVTVTFDDDTSTTPEVTIPALTAGTGLTFTLTVTGRGGTDGIVPATDTATVTATASNDAKLSALTVNDGTSDLTLAPAFASGTFVYAADVATAVDEVTLSATVNHAGASVSAVTLNGTAVADSDFTDGITVSGLLAGGNDIVVTVTAEDTSTTRTYTVTVTANTAPTALDASVITNEDTAYTFGAADFNFDDTDSGDALASVTVVTLPAEGALELDGTAVTTGQSVPAADIGKLAFTPAANAHGDAYASFTFRVHDGTDESASAYTMTVNVTAMNDPATGAPTIGGTAQVGQTLTAATTAIVDMDGLTSPTYGYQWIRVDADGTSNPTDITGATLATYTPVRADVGNKLRVKVSFTDDDSNDEELTSDAYPASGTVEAAPNAAPSFTSLATFDAAENQTAVGTVAASDGDPGDGVTGYAIESGADAARFTIVEATGELAFTSAPNFEAPADADGDNDYAVVVRATSGTGARLKTADQTITVTVTDEDGEAPGAPATPSVSTASVTSVTVAWAAPSNAGPPITDYDYRYRVKTPRGPWTEVTNTPITALSATIAGLAENTEYEVQVRATSAEGTGDWSDPPGSGATDANAAPSFTSAATFDAAENQTAVGTVAASDGDPGDGVTGYAIESGADAARFTIVEATGELAFTSAPNFEAPADADGDNDYAVVVRATSGTGAREKTADQTITVTVTDEAGEAPGAPATPSVSTASVTSVTVAWAAPSNAGPPITDYDYRYRVKTPRGPWTEVTNTPITALSATIAGLAENTEYEVQVRATSAEGTGDWSDPPGSGATDANAAPSFTSAATFDAAENQTAVGTVAASDGDPGDGVTGYAIESGADAARFTIVEATGELAFTSAPNFEAPADADGDNDYAVVVRATSGTGAREKTADQTITVTVTDEDGEAPGAPATPSVSTASVTSVTVAWAAPSNAGPAITDYDYRYRVKTPRGPWTEVTNTPITALSATIAGLAENTEYEVQVRATSAEGTGDWSDPPGSGATDANAAPSFTSAATFDAAENQTAVGTVAASDGDPGDGVTGYAIESGADAARFTIVEATGELAFTSAPNFEAPADADGDNDYAVVVRATSGTGAREKTADQTITVTVTDEAGEAPGAPATPSVSTASVTSVTVAWAAPSNAGPPITDYDYRYRVKTPRGPWTEVTTTPITALSTTIAGLAENTEYEVQVRATSAEGTGDWSDPPGSGATDANAAPSFTSAATFDAAENQTAVGTVAASDGDPGDGVTGYAIESGADAARFTIVEATGELAFTSAPNFEAPADADGDNDYAVVVRATSGTGARLKTADQTITVTVTDEDGEAPGAPATPSVSTASVTSVTVAWAAPSNAGPPITDYDYRYRVKTPRGPWTEVTNTPITALSATIAGLAENTEYEVQVRATSAEGTGDWSDPPGSGATDANAAPSFTSAATFDAAENQTAVGTVAASDGDPGDGVTGYAIESGADAARFTIVEATGELAFTSAPNFEAPADADGDNDYAVVVRATSGTGARLKTADQTITVTVTDEDGEAPGAPATPSVSTASVTSVTVAWAAPSNAGPPITDYDYRYRVKTPRGPWTEVTNTPITALSTTIAGLAENTEYEVQVRATSAEGTGDWSDPPGSGATDANAAPSFTSPATFDAAENQTAVGTVAASDSDAGDGVTGYAIEGGADAARFTIVEATGELAFTSAPNFEAPADADGDNDYAVVVRATSGTGARLKTADQTITVTVTDEDGEAPGAPATPSVSTASVTSVTVAWAAPSNAGPPITDYDYRYRVKTPRGPWTEVTTTPITALSTTIAGLAENTEYEVQVRATSAEGTGDWSDPPGSGATDANAAPSFTSAATFDAAENQTAVGTVAASDGDAGDGVTGYAIESGADAARFTIVEATGELAFTSAPNFEAPADADGDNDYAVVVRATSGTGAREKTADQTITVTVTDEAGEAPGAPATPSVSTASVTSVTVAWAAPSNAGPPITDYDYRYRVKTPRGPWTEVTNTPITALSATIAGLAENTEYEVQVRATSAEGTGDWSDPPGSGATDANAAPSFTSAATFDAAENQTVAGTVAASDGDAGDGVTGYAIESGADAARFTIVEATGELAFTSAPNFEAPADADGDNEYVVVVRATSGTGAREKTADQTITVTVTDEAGEAPGAPATPTVSTASVTSVTVAWAAPSNAGPAITDYDYRYRVKTPRGPWTEVTTTPITALSTTIAGLAENTEYEVQVRATNAEGTGDWSDPPGSGATDANAAPSFTTAATFDAAENQTAVDTVAASDGDAGDGVTGYAIEGGADAARFTIVEATGELAFTSAPNFEAPADADGDNDYVVVVRATSGTGAREKTADQTITVTVTDEAGEAPGAPATPTVSTASVTSVTVAWAAPPNAGPAITDYDYRYRVKTPRGPWTEVTNTPITALSTTIAGLAENTEYEVQVRATNAEGTGGWSDPPGSGATDAAPSFTIAPASASEGDAVTFTATLAAAATQAVTVDYATSVAASDTAAPTDFTAVSGTLTFAAGETQQTFTVGTVEDSIDESDETFTVTLAGVTPAGAATLPADPTATGTIIDDDAAPVLELSVNPETIAEAGGTSAVTVSTGAGSTFRDDRTITLVVSGTATETADYNISSKSLTLPAGVGSGASSVTATVTAVDDNFYDGRDDDETIVIAGSREGTAFGAQHTISIADDEYSPEFTLILTPASISESGGTSIVTGTLDTPIAEALTGTLGTFLDPNADPPVVAGDYVISGSLTFAAHSTQSTGTLTVTAVDNRVHTDDKLLDLEWIPDLGYVKSGEAYLIIEDDDAAPSFTSLATFDAAENQTAVGTVAASDGDAGDGVTGYAIESGADAARFTIVEATGELAFTSAPNFEAPTDADGDNDYAVVVRATSGTGAREKTADQTITVTVTDEAGEAPGAPATPTVSSASVSSVTVAWAAPSNAGPAITDYDYRYRVKTPRGPWTEVTSTPITALSTTIAGLAENTEYEVQVRATNAEGTGDWSDPPGSGATDANAAPSFTTPATFDAAENQTAAGTVAASDGDPGDGVTGYAIESGADAARFTIVEATGELAFTSAPNFEAPADADTDNDYVVVVRATSGTGAREKTADQTITVTVTDEAGEAPGAPATPSVSTASVTSVTVAWAAPSNAGPPITDYDYRYRVKTPRGPWTEVTNTPITALSTTIAGLAENTEYEVQVRATNAEGTGGWSDPPGSGATDANAAPSFTSPATFDAAENQTVVGTVAASDGDAGDSVTGYALQGGADQSKFTIVEATGELTFDAAPNFEAEADADADNDYVVVVRATSGTGARLKTADQTITVTVTDEAGEAPGAPATPAVSSASASSLNVSWTAPSNAGPAITDYDYRYRVKTPAGPWTEVTNTPITALGATIAGLAENTEYEVQVRATNAEGTGGWSDPPGSGSTDANAAPSFTSPATFDAAENQTAVGTVAASDGDPGDGVTGYAIESGADQSRFTIVEATGELTFDAAPNFEAEADADADNDYVVVVRATSGTGARLKTADQTITVTVTDEAGEAPGAPATPTVSTASVTSVTVTWAAPANAGPPITDYDYRYRVKTPRGPWTEVTTTPITALAATIAGLAENTEYEVQVRATNAEGTGGWSDPPGSGSTGSTANNAPVFSDATLTRSMAENTAENMNIGAAIPAATDADGDSLTYSMEGTDAASFAFDAATRQIKTGAALDFESRDSYSVTVRADDGNGGADTIAVTIDVTDVDEPPDAPAAPSVSATPGSTTSLDVGWTAPRNSGRPAITSYDLQYRVGGGGSFTAGPRDVAGTSATIAGLAKNTEYQVQVRATNDEGDSDWSAPGTGSTGRPSPPPRNHEPEFPSGAVKRSVAENTPADSDIGAPIPAATDADGDSLTYSMEGTDAASFAFDASTRQIKTGAALDFESGDSYSVTVRADDGRGGTATIAVTIDVTDVDEPPDAPAAPSVSATPGSTTSLDVGWTAPPNSGRPAITSYDLQYRVGGGGSFTAGPRDVAGTSATIAGLAENTEYEVQVRATNDEGDSDWSAPGTGSTGRPRNHEPEFPSGTVTRSVAENTPADSDIGAPIPAATDADGDSLTYSMEGTDAASFAFDASTRQIKTGAALDFESRDSYSVTVRADDGRGGADTIAVTIDVTDADEPPEVPVAPSVSATPGSTTSLDVGWTAPPNSGRPAITSYDLQYRVGGGGSFTAGPRDVAGTSATIAGLAENTAYQVQVRATNDEGDSDWSAPGTGRTGRPSPPGNNEPEFPSGTVKRSVAENTPADSDIGAPIPAATDADGDSLTYSLTYSMEGTDAAAFAFDASTRQIKTGAALDFESTDSYSVTVMADDGRGGADTIAVTIDVTDADEPPDAPAAPSVSATPGSTTSLDVGWTAPPNSGRPAISSYDLQYRVGGGGSFTAGPRDVAGTSATIAGLAENTAYQVQVRATNDEGDSDWSAPGMPVNNAPVFSDATLTRSIAENTAENMNIGAAIPAATDADGDSLTYSMEGTDAASFAFDASTRQIKTGAALDFESRDSYSVTVRADDGHGGTATIAVTISVTDVGESVEGMSQGWLTRFGRTVSDNAVRAIEDRWRGERIVREPSHLTLGGWRVNSSLLGGDADRTGGAASRAERLLETVIRRGGQGGWKLPELRDVLQGSSFSYSGSLDRTGDHGAEGDEPWQWSVWGGVGRTRFDGMDGALSLDGDVSTGTLGADLHRGRWLTGVALSYSKGAGSYRREADEGGLSAELTSVHPFVRYELSERTSLWGVLGYGAGKLTPPPSDSDSDRSRDLTTKMVAVGGRGVLSKATGGFELAIRSDARATVTTADASAGLMGSSGLTSRVRLLLEGTGSRTLASGGVLSTTLEGGLRYDDGEAETGGGVEGGGGLMYASGRVAVQVNARALVAHEDEQYKEWGVSGSLLYRPRSDGNGLSLRLGPAWGATESGVQSLWSRQDARGLARGGMAMDAAQRVETELGYGLAGRKADARWYPYIALQAADGAGEMLTMGLKIISGSNVEAGLGFVRRDNGREAIEHTVKLSGSFRW